MARKQSKMLTAPQPGEDWLFPAVSSRTGAKEPSLLDVVDNVLNHGVVLQGELLLGVANVDLIYAKLSLLLAAFDKVSDARRTPVKRGRRRGSRSRAGQ